MGASGLRTRRRWLNEVVPVGDLSYVVYPPAPALLVLPFVAAFGPEMNQAWPSIGFGALNVAIVSLILRRMGVERGPRVILSLVFAFGTITWYSAQAGLVLALRPRGGDAVHADGHLALPARRSARR